MFIQLYSQYYFYQLVDFQRQRKRLFLYKEKTRREIHIHLLNTGSTR